MDGLWGPGLATFAVTATGGASPAQTLKTNGPPSASIPAGSPDRQHGSGGPLAPHKLVRERRAVQAFTKRHGLA